MKPFSVTHNFFMQIFGILCFLFKIFSVDFGASTFIFFFIEFFVFFATVLTIYGTIRK